MKDCILQRNTFKDKRIYEAASDLWSDCRASRTTPGSLKQIRIAFQHVINAGICNIIANDINREYCYDYICATDKSGERTLFIKLIIKLIDKGAIADKDLMSLSKEPFRSYICTGIRKEVLKKIFSSDNMSSFFVVRVKDKKNCIYRLGYAETSSPELVNLLCGFVDSRKDYDQDFKFCNSFTTSLQGHVVNRASDLSFDTFISQTDFFREHNSDEISSVVAFYLFVLQSEKINVFSESGISIDILNKNRLTSLLKDNYKIVKYNPLETIPDYDKWILCYDLNKSTTNIDSHHSFYAINFTDIKEPVYRNWYKTYIWNADAGLYTKIHPKSQVTLFFNYISDIKNGEVLTLRSTPSKSIDITISDVTAYKDYIMASYSNNRTINGLMYNPRAVLNYVKECNLADIPDGIFYYLSNSLDSKYDNNKAIPDADLEKLCKAFSDKANSEGGIFDICYLVLFLGLETRFRISHILALETDCIRETAKEGEFVLYSKEKTGGKDPKEQAISSYTKKHLDKIKNLTEPYRQECEISSLKRKLFICKHHNKNNGFISVTPKVFNYYLGVCCKEAGLPHYSFRNIRSTHITKAYEFKLREKLSDMELITLTGHASKETDYKHYLDTPINELLEAVHGIVIGDVNLNGEIVPNVSEAIKTKEHTVSEQCGYCNNSSCDDFSYLDCMLCKHFVTTVDRLPYFEERMAMLNKAIENTDIQHDKECLVTIKRLVAGYMREIMSLMKTEEH